MSEAESSDESSPSADRILIYKPKWTGGKDEADEPLRREDLPCPPDTLGYLYLTNEQRSRVLWDPVTRHWWLHPETKPHGTTSESGRSTSPE